MPAATPKRDYRYAVGRRKTAVARVRYYQRSKEPGVTVNGKPHTEYFPTDELRDIVVAPLKAVGLEKATISAKVAGGGKRGQAESVRLGIARILLLLDEGHRATLKPLGYLTRDPRAKERKKFGLKRARRSPQWSKR